MLSKGGCRIQSFISIEATAIRHNDAARAGGGDPDPAMPGAALAWFVPRFQKFWRK